MSLRYKDVPMQEVLKKVFEYNKTFDAASSSAIGYILQIKDIKDEKLEKVLSESGIKKGDFVGISSDVVLDAIDRRRKLNHQTRDMVRNLKNSNKADVVESAKVFDGMFPVMDFEIIKINESESGILSVTDQKLYINSSIAEKIVCDVDVDREKIMQKVKCLDGLEM